MYKTKETTENSIGHPYLSIIIPIRDEEQNIVPLAKEIGEIMISTSWPWECLWIDDGSTDRTNEEIKRLNRDDSRHQLIAFDGNYGQSAALHAGFFYARGDILTTMDGDGQNDPGDIPKLVNKLLETGSHMVNGWRINRMDTFVRKASSFIANSFRNWITGDDIKDVGCSMRAFRKECVKDIQLFMGMHRFLPTLVLMEGYTKRVEMPVRHRPRKYGYTKYGINNRLWVGIADSMAVRWMQRRKVRPKIKTSTFHDGKGD